MEAVEAELEEADLEPVAPEPPPAEASAKQRKRRRVRQSAQQKKIRNAIKKRPAKGIDPRKSLRQQEFSKITMGEGKTAEEVFSELYLKQKS